MLPSPIAIADFDRAAMVIGAARRVLVTGLVSAGARVAIAACDLAEAAGAVVDAGSPETGRVAGPILARIGGVTAAAEELRDRADLVVLWFCDPNGVAPGFTDTFVAPPANGRPRRTIAVGPHPIPVAGTAHRHIALPADAAIDAARLIEALTRGVAIDQAACDATTLAAARDLAAAFASGSCVGIVTNWAADAVGLEAWSTAAVVRSLAHRLPAFEVPLGERTDAAVAVCTWRYGAAGGIERADPMGGRFLPGEADAVRLIDRREVDCVVVVGEAVPEVTAAIHRAAGAVAVVRLPAEESVVRSIASHVLQAGASR